MSTEAPKRPMRFEFAFERRRLHPYSVYVDRREHLPGEHSSYHRHDFPQIWYCYRGHYTHRIADQTYDCQEGSVVIIPAGTPHQVLYDETTDMMCLSVFHDILDLEAPENYKHSVINLYLREFSQEIGISFAPYTMLSARSRQVMEEAFSWFVLIDYAPEHTATLSQIRGKLEEVFSIPELAIPDAYWEKAMHIAQTRLCPIMRVVSYLNDHYPEKITDDKLLQAGNISRAVMYRYFKRIMNETYSRYLQNLRARHAHIYIKYTTYSLSRIAELCGFYDSYHMSQNYTKHIGSAIGEQRRKFERIREGKEEACK